MTLAFLRDIAMRLVDIHSQHQTYTYLQSKYHIELLDSYIESIDTDFKKTLEQYKNNYSQFKEVTKKLETIENSEKESKEKN